MFPLSELRGFTLFANLDENKSDINIPNKLIKMAASSLASSFTKFITNPSRQERVRYIQNFKDNPIL